MLDASTLLSAVLPIYLLAVIGIILRRTGALTEQMDRGIFKIVIHCLYPCLIVDKMLGNPLVAKPSVVFWGIGVGLGLVTIGYVVSYIVAKCLKLDSGHGLRTFTLSSAIQNYGYTAIPILLVLFQSDNILGILFIHSLGVEIAIWTIGLMLLTGAARPSLQNFVNGPILSVIIGLVLVYTGLASYFSPPHLEGGTLIGGIIRSSMSWLGACAFPIALLLIGATIYDLAGSEKFSAKITIGSLIVRCVIMPLIILCAAKWLPLITELKQVLLVQASMPAAVTPIVIARHYGGRPAIAVQVVIVTSIAGIVTIPLIIAWGYKFLGL